MYYHEDLSSKDEEIINIGIVTIANYEDDLYNTRIELEKEFKARNKNKYQYNLAFTQSTDQINTIKEMIMKMLTT